MTIDFPREQFTRLAGALRTAKDTASQEIVSQQFKLTIRDAIAATPPFDAPGFGEGGSLFQHRKTGEAAVKRDLRKVFRPFSSLKVSHGRGHAAVWLRKYAREGNLQGVATILRNLGIPFERIVTNIESLSQIHASRRGSRGRIRRDNPGNIVLNEKALQDYTREMVSHVGRAKAGWLELAIIAGITNLLEWITRHAGEPFLFDDHRADRQRPSVTFGNLVEFVDDFADLKILETVFENRIRSMQGELDAVLAGNARRELRQALGAGNNV